MTIISGTEWIARPGSVGRCVVGEMKVVGEDGRELGANDVGEIYLRP